ncbi:hypothetical protein CEG14_04120 [Bordetella genomosp. 1]|uniref:Xylosidase n=1 Tax=Bordetella genomosp. 1 TaxID=1395607 RepID=A0A261SV21_9BORD|nr:hypothetical protein CEG14_04120 [Bordetella genomosp. 1]
MHGSVFAPNASEPQGIGPAQVFYDGSSARPFKMIYLVRGTPVGTTLRLADSTDGQNWTRVGDVLTSTEPFEATGVSPSWVFQNENGEWVLLYHAYESLDKAHAAIAYAPSLGTPFANKKIIYSPDGKQHAVSGALKSSNVATVSGTVLIGQPHVLRANDGSAMEPVIPVKQVGTTVYFDRPLLAAYPSGTMASVLRNKVDPSYVVKEADGTYMAYFTGYGQFPGVLSEYTARFRSPALTGPWTAAKDGFGFQPWAPDSILSTENPAAVIQAQ